MVEAGIEAQLFHDEATFIGTTGDSDGTATKASRQPKRDTTTSPGLNSVARDSTTSPTAPPSSALLSSKGGTYDFPSFIRPRMYGSTDMNRCRTSTCSASSGGSVTTANVKLAAVGMPLGREARRISRLVVSLVIKWENLVGELASG